MLHKIIATTYVKVPKSFERPGVPKTGLPENFKATFLV